MIGSVRRAMFGLSLAAAGSLLRTGSVRVEPKRRLGSGSRTTTHVPQGAPAEIDADHLLAFSLDAAALKDRLADAPAAGLRSRALARPPRARHHAARAGRELQRFEVRSRR